MIGIGLAIFVTRGAGREFAPMVSAIAAAGQTFPPVAVLALAVPLLGYGAAPALAALSLYAILPVLDGTLSGLANVPAAARNSAIGLGFAPAGLLWRIELPLGAAVHSGGPAQRRHHQYRNGDDWIERRRAIARFTDP